MKAFLLTTSLFASFSLLFINSAFAEPKAGSAIIEAQTEKGPLKRIESQLVEVDATVKSVDQKTRMLTLNLPKGKSVTLTASPKVKRLSEVKAGDTIAVKYYKALAFEVRKPTKEELANPTQTTVGETRHGKDLPPGSAAAAVTKTIVTITGIDLENNTAVIKFPDGETSEVTAKVPANLKRVKVGDTVAITYSQGFAISLEPKTVG